MPKHRLVFVFSMEIIPTQHGPADKFCSFSGIADDENHLNEILFKYNSPVPKGVAKLRLQGEDTKQLPPGVLSQVTYVDLDKVLLIMVMEESQLDLVTTPITNIQKDRRLQ